MPILSIKNNPISRYPNQCILDSKQTWWIAKVKPRMEKALAREFFESKVEYYIPYYTNIIKRADSTAVRKSFLPLFPSYVPFACSNNPWELLQNNRITTILPVKAQGKFKHELNQIYLAYEKNVSLYPVLNESFIQEQSVQVVSGPLKGTVGRVARLKGSEYLVLSVSGLGEACVSINMCDICIV
ncbi:MAG: hypothetical protein Q4F84_01815 [Fibrobacter sp.]|nr:hypothetical protein [Fibrobacter sp.]